MSPPSPAAAGPADADRRAPPALEIARTEHVVVVHWLSVPTMIEVERVSAAYEQAFRAAKRPLIAIGHLHPEVDGNPTPSVRNQMVARSRQLLGQTCDSMHMIISRAGVAGAMQRTVLRGMAVVIGGRGKLFVHESVGACLDRLRADGVDGALFAWVERALSDHGRAIAASPVA